MILIGAFFEDFKELHQYQARNAPEMCPEGVL
jgi:hypothetical protein